MSYLKIGKYYGSDETKSTYQFKNTLDTDYADISDVYMWFEVENFTDVDYLYGRLGAIGFINNNGGFSALTETHKEIAIQNFCVGQSDRGTIYTSSEQEFYWSKFIKKSEICRDGRWDRAKSYISFRLTSSEGSDLSVDTLILNEKYIKYGIEDLSTDGIDGLYDWLNGVSSFSQNGFPSKTYYNEIYKNGIISILNCEQ